jgi:hypothetical protein
MKSERRHELQHNELADWIFTTGQNIKPYQNAILAAVVALIVAVGAYSWWSRSSATKAAEAWAEVTNGLQSDNPDMLASVAETNPNSNVGFVASVALADVYLAKGCDARMVDKAASQKALSSAIKAYTAILEQCKTPSLRERATFGVARAFETQCDLEAALKRYEEIVNNWPEGTYAAAAKQRLHDLHQHDTKKMYDDLHNYEPKPSFTNEMGGTGLPSGFDLPEEKPIDSPKTKPEPKADQKKPVTKADQKKPVTKTDEKKPEKGTEKKK